MKSIMKKIWSFLKHNIAVTLLVILLIIFLIFTYNTIQFGLINHELATDINAKVQMITIPVSAIGIIISLINSNRMKTRQLMLEKAKVTSSFAKSFKDLMDKYPVIHLIKKNHLEKNELMSNLFRLVLSKDRLEFSEEYFMPLVKEAGLTIEKINDYINVIDEKSKENHINSCKEFFWRGSYAGSQSSFRDMYTEASKNTDALNKEINDLKEELCKLETELCNLKCDMDQKSNVKCEDNLEDDSDLKNIENNQNLVNEKKSDYKDSDSLECYKNQESKIEKTKNIIIKKEEEKKCIECKISEVARRQDSSFLNDLECLCMEVKFELISYPQIYHLLIAPVNSYVTHMYIDIMVTRIFGERKGYYYFSNIIKLYTELSRIKFKITKVVKKSRNRANAEIHEVVSDDVIRL